MKEKTKKLSYEELQKLAGELSQENQKLVAKVHELIDALDNKQFEYMAFFLNNLFKVMENVSMYSDEFIAWCVNNIETAMYSFGSNNESTEKEDKPAES